MENNFRISGWAFLIYGALSLTGFTLAFIFGLTQMQAYTSLPLYVHLLINLVLAVHFLVLLSRYYLLKQNPQVHKFALPLSLILLISIPVGTVVGFLYLYQRAKNT